MPDPNEIFHENIFLTFVFLGAASFGIIQIMVAYKNIHGLSLTGIPVNKPFNYMLGTALIFGSYYWYFTNPDHGNVRNIEGLMSLVCLILGLAAALAATVLISSVSIYLRRKSGFQGFDDSCSVRRNIEIDEDGWISNPSISPEETSHRAVAYLFCGKEGFHRIEKQIACVLIEKGIPCRVYKSDWWSGYPNPSKRDIDEIENDIADYMKDQEESEHIRIAIGAGLGAGVMLRCGVRFDFALAVCPPVGLYEENSTVNTIGIYGIAEAVSAIGEQMTKLFPRTKRTFITWLFLSAAAFVPAALALIPFDFNWKYLSIAAGGLVAGLWATYYYLKKAKGKSLGNMSDFFEKMESLIDFGAFRHDSIEHIVAAYPLETELFGDHLVKRLERLRDRGFLFENLPFCVNASRQYGSRSIEEVLNSAIRDFVISERR